MLCSISSAAARIHHTKQAQAMVLGAFGRQLLVPATRTNRGFPPAPAPAPAPARLAFASSPHNDLSLCGMIQRPCRITCATKQSEGSSPRRSANYHPTIWDHRAIESFGSPYTGKVLDGRREELKLEVKSLLEGCEDPLGQLQLIDSTQRLGVAYHFEEEIKDILHRVHSHGFESFKCVNEIALCFRLLRQHGYSVSSDVFNRFRDGNNGFMDCLTQDVKGLLSLYEASYLAIDGEQVLEEANEFSVRHLKRVAEKVGQDLRDHVRHSLKVPLHWRMPRLEARHYIDVYQREEGRSSALLELAKVDFNVVQTIHQEELKELSRWWKELGLGEKLKFSRDRLVENYLWAAGIVSEPQFSRCRKGLTKLICILTVIDDIYDIYGSLEEVKLFTLAIKRWDPTVMRSFHDNFKLCYWTVYNFVKGTAHNILEDDGMDVISFLKREWEMLCVAYLVEAEWFDKGYKPSFKEYLKNAWISVGGPIAMVHAYTLTGDKSGKNLVGSLQPSCKLIYWSSLITRLSDDLGTSKAEMERGDIPKSIQCHMNETGESEEASTEYVKSLIDHSWKELNNECLRTHLPRDFVNMVLNMARTAQCIFQHGDGIGISAGLTKNRITSLFVEQVPL